MKRSIVILTVSLLVITAVAQGKFTVPSLTDIQKYQLAAYNLNGMYLIQISYAKSLGKPVADVARFTGEHLKGSWLKTGGFDSFVHGILNLMISMVPYGSVEIIEQKDNELVYKVTGLYSELREGGSIFNVTWEEYLNFLDIVISSQADYMGTKYSQKDTDEGLIVTLRKNKISDN